MTPSPATSKTNHAYRDGFKAHVATEPETGLVTDCDLTPGNTADGEAAPGLIDDDPEGTEVLGDSAYGTGEFRDHLERSAKAAVIKPPPLRPAVPGGFNLDDFEIDDEARTLTCPAGVVVPLTSKGRASFGVNCRSCPLRSRCTTVRGGRRILLHPHHRHLVAARAQARTEEFELVYRRWRPMVERTLAWLTRGANPKLRYRGVERNQLWWSHRCAAVNLQRLITLGLVADDDGGWAIAWAASRAPDATVGQPSSPGVLSTTPAATASGIFHHRAGLRRAPCRDDQRYRPCSAVS